MSVFESLKGTLHSVQQDIFDGFKALTSLEGQPRHDVLQRLRTDGASLDAGADILHKYQQSWKELQQYTTCSAKKAQKVDHVIGHMYTWWEREVDKVSRLEEELEELPVLTELIGKLTRNLEYIQEDFRVVEGALDRLESVCEDQEQQKNTQSHLEQLAAYELTKKEEIQKIKIQLAKTHVHVVQQVNLRRHEYLQDRHDAFTDAFSQDMDYYKTHGHIGELKVADIRIPKVSSLSDITIDEDENAIDDFLDSTETTLSKEKTDSGEFGEMLGIFIEDDYTTDYKIQRDEDLLEDVTVQMEQTANTLPPTVQEDRETSSYTASCEQNVLYHDPDEQVVSSDSKSKDKSTESDENISESVEKSTESAGNTTESVENTPESVENSELVINTPQSRDNASESAGKSSTYDGNTPE